MTRLLSIKLISIVSLLLLGGGSCNEDLKLAPIGTELSGPIALTTDKNAEHFYVLNSDFRHAYQSGSILILDKDGNKVNFLGTPRLGRVMVRKDSNLLVAYDREEEGDLALFEHYDISTPTQPKQVRSQNLDEDCTPANIVARDGYDYYALSCQEGGLYIGDITKNTLKKVRDYPKVPGGIRRAMFIDKTRGLLYLFMTDISGGVLVDKQAEDKETWVEGQKTIADAADEIPDNLQSTAPLASNTLNATTAWQFMVYDITAEKAADFPYRDFKKVRTTEPRWLYFDLKNWDQTPDISLSPGTRYYRTNFWSAEPDNEKDDVFYLSHRGTTKTNRSEHANSVVEVKLSGNPRVNSKNEVPKLDTYMKFRRVYGFKGNQTGTDRYFNSFMITELSGKKVVLLNSFRDLSNFSNPRYLIGGAEIPEKEGMQGVWSKDKSSTDLDSSYYELALIKDGNTKGNLLTISFFNESLVLFRVEFGKDLSLVKTIQ